MVQGSLRKTSCIVGSLLLCLLVWGVLAFTDYVDCRHAANDRMRPDPLDVAELNRLAPPSRVSIDSEQKAELEKIYSDIVRAYSNRQVEVLREWRQKLPGMVVRIRQDDFDDIERPFFKVFFDEVVSKLKRKQDHKSILEEYESAIDFERSVATMLVYVGVYGDTHLRRRDFGGVFDSIEALVVYRLKSYIECFRATGRTDMAEVADRFLAEWIDQIESVNGYTRALLIRSIVSGRVWANNIMENHNKTWEEISQNLVRQATYGLICAGYTPKWLDEFKNIPRHAVSCGGGKSSMSGDLLGTGSICGPQMIPIKASPRLGLHIVVCGSMCTEIMPRGA